MKLHTTDKNKIIDIKHRKWADRFLLNLMIFRGICMLTEPLVIWVWMTLRAIERLISLFLSVLWYPQLIAWLSLNFILSTSWVALYSVVCEWVSQALLSPDQISTFSNIYRHTSPLLTLYPLISSITNLYWPVPCSWVKDASPFDVSIFFFLSGPRNVF